ncbi:hypothetical protein L2E82_10580 [Cichorium intybus]|uniref:Uncharacterized protein n=1 Tax=Cichorium intybus TaxID=13427 RepID=A0ACB9GC63_CICIN|nr:hypothetical protein L2E82_10580 [Cichorium intybus]
MMGRMKRVVWKIAREARGMFWKCPESSGSSRVRDISEMVVLVEVKVEVAMAVGGDEGGGDGGGGGGGEWW